MSSAAVAKVIDGSGRALCDLLAFGIFAVENAKRVGFKPLLAGVAQLV